MRFEDETHDFVLLLDDVGHHRQADQIEGIGLADAEIAVRALARLNATWWEHPDLLASPYVRPLNECRYRGGGDELRTAAWPMTRSTRTAGRCPTRIRAFGPRYSSLFPWFCDRLCEPPVTLTRGNWRGDNLFFTGDAEVPLVAVDWQLISVAKGVKDFTYFVTQSLRPGDRAAHEEGLLRIWLDELHGGRHRRLRVCAGVGGLPPKTYAWAFVYPVIATSTLGTTEAHGRGPHPFDDGALDRRHRARGALELIPNRRRGARCTPRPCPRGPRTR